MGLTHVPTDSEHGHPACRYQLRKINADKRPRIKGRFVKKEELDEYMKVDVPFPGKLEDDCCSDDIDEEEECPSDKE
jgi:hypothetical protein